MSWNELKILQKIAVVLNWIACVVTVVGLSIPIWVQVAPTTLMLLKDPLDFREYRDYSDLDLHSFHKKQFTAFGFWTACTHKLQCWWLDHSVYEGMLRSENVRQSYILFHFIHVFCV